MKCIVYNKLTFTNKEIDYTLDLHYFGARYYSSTLPRFISPDPVNGTPTKPLSWNRYLYCANDPINKIDPTGCSWDAFGSAGKALKNTKYFKIGAYITGGFMIVAAIDMAVTVSDAKEVGQEVKKNTEEAQRTQGDPNKTEMGQSYRDYFYSQKGQEPKSNIDPTDSPSTDTSDSTETPDSSDPVDSNPGSSDSGSDDQLPEYEKKWRNGEIGPGEYNRLKAEDKANSGY